MLVLELVFVLLFLDEPCVDDDVRVRLDPGPAAALGQEAKVACGYLAFDEYCVKRSG